MQQQGSCAVFVGSCTCRLCLDLLSRVWQPALDLPCLPCLPPSPQAQSKRVGELGPGGPPDQLRLLLSNVQLVASIFYSLNSPGLTDVSRG